MSVTDFDVSFARVLSNVLSNYEIDLIHVAYPSGIITTKGIMVLNGVDIPIILDAHDVMSVRVWEMDNEDLSWVENLGKRIYTPLLESLATRLADHAIVVSEKDRALLARENPIALNHITVVPNGAEPLNSDELAPREEVRRQYGFNQGDVLAVFHGNYDSGYHNREATELILNDLAPKFESINSEIHFIVAGKNVPKRESENVTCLGFVEDLYSLLNAADLAAVPLLSGTATKLKIFDYLSVGLPIVTTQKGSEGIDLEHGKSALITETVDKEFIKYINQLATDVPRRRDIGENGQELIKTRYNWEKIGSNLRGVYSSQIQ